MIVRILGSGHYEIAETDAPELAGLDTQLTRAVDANDEPAFEDALRQIIERVHQVGTKLPSDDLQPSELVVPHESATLAEVRALLAEES